MHVRPDSEISYDLRFLFSQSFLMFYLFTTSSVVLQHVHKQEQNNRFVCVSASIIESVK